ncbi:MAG TPA: 50S ribosomal protein L11 methyltransferase [Solirubrobacteraceae bacterium]|nr:50S ribosomal protein L11 methyltransferase [Solirubrobacteraceae bacterium]
MLRLALRVRRADAEIVLAELLELAPGGVEECDIDLDTVEYAVYGAPGELPELPDLRAVAGEAFVELRTIEVADDWAERWREFHRPLVLGDRLAVRPPWEPPQPTDVDLVIDPGRAFGTGAHATTRLCLELLLDLPRPGPPGPLAAGPAAAPAAIDLGSGSGVLAIAAATLGWAPTLALDHDPLAVQATARNAEINGVSERIEARRFDLTRETVPPARLVLANLLRPLLLAWAARMSGPAHEWIVASGLLVEDADPVIRALAPHGYQARETRTRGGWAALLLQGTPGG